MATALIVSFFTISLLPSDTGRRDSGKVLRVGAGDDTSGLLLEKIVEASHEAGSNTRIVYSDFDMEAYKFQDC